MDPADAVDVNTKTNEKNSTKSAGLLFGKTLKILVGGKPQDMMTLFT